MNERLFRGLLMPTEEEDSVSVELQHINVKLFLRDTEDLDLDAVVPVFHSWIQEQIFDELLLDVADYRHVPAGPGIVLIGHEADYSIDNARNRLGVRYNRKALLEGNNVGRLEQALRAVTYASLRLQTDTRLNGKVNFDGCEIEILINDRLLAPNLDETRVAVEADLRAFLTQLFAGNEYSLCFENDRRRLFGVSIRTERAFTVTELLENLVQIGRYSPHREG